MVEWFSDPSIFMGLATLIILEIILGIDNLVFIAILADKLPPDQRDKARLIGLSLALAMRLVLLATLSWIMKLTTPLFSVWSYTFSGRDLILLSGGLFLLFKATMELHERIEGEEHDATGNSVYASFGLVVTQIVVLDAVFSLDSVITAVGMVDELGIMMIAVIIAMSVMMWASKPLTAFVSRHPSVVILCLGFLLMIGFSLIAEGFGFKIPKGYLYAAIAFSVLIEAFNQWSRFNRERLANQLPLRQRTANAVIRLLGARPAKPETPSFTEGKTEHNNTAGLEASEHNMIRSVLTLADRNVTSVMTIRSDIVWIDLRKGLEHAKDRLTHSTHSRLLVADGELDHFIGIVQSRDLLARFLTGEAFSVMDTIREPLIVPETVSALSVLEQIRKHPIPLAVVVDEYGSIEGIVTANDLLATIAGDLVDTKDPDDQIQQIDENTWLIDGSVSLEDIEHSTDICLKHDPAYVTLSGLILHTLDRMPEAGDVFDFENYTISVLSLERRRVHQARITRLSSNA